ncbi:MAG: 6-bladed beta-propeller, partial [Bacteroidales bacterium]|nr:6-bladed beta-propeller [Bacteroidales bacterium]
MNKYIGLFLCLAIVISCEHSSQLSSFDYKDLKNAPVLSLEDVFEPIKFIPLKTTESHPISNILKVCMTEDSFYILAVNPYGIFRFALDGSLISTISVEGRAEGEYLIPTDIAYSKADDVLYVADVAKGIMKFSSDGKYLSTVSTPTKYKIRQLLISESGSVIDNVLNVTGNEREAIVELSQEGDTLNSVPNSLFFDCVTPTTIDT